MRETTVQLNYLEPAVSSGMSGHELLSDNPVRIRGNNSLVLFAIALIKSALGGLFLAVGMHMRLSLIVSDPPAVPSFL
jgi:hypothetical protein